MKIKKDLLNFLIRLLTGFFYVLLIVFSIENGEKIFRIIMMILSFFCLFEFLIISGTNIILIKISSLFFILSILIDILMIKKGLNSYIVCFIPYSIIFFVIQLFSDKYSHKEKIAQVSHLTLGLVYIIIPFYLASYIYTTVYCGKNLILGIFILIWTHDSLSYLIGKKWGKTKIAVSISPNKSIEGFLGGLFFCLILGFFLFRIWGKKYWFILSFVIPILSTIGDFVESIIKRSYNVKNSSVWLPGHGGFLDRLDSFIFVIPIISTIVIGILYFF
ncbi:phosphatidate cytidylyltransferase [Blattabacterium cuenoti]|uniref:phosphatidate cytidylyltransferase n=1 Tax=Blattabacterium cuenoti TaxID=1653831 RepID=UPI00163C9D98|nr:phosphatidate cytidylyltransferase [Blattabacterium cuenoti]